MIHLIFCIESLSLQRSQENKVREQKNVNRHRFVAFCDRGFPFLLGPVCTTTKKRVWRLQNFENVVITNFCVFAILLASETNEIFVWPETYGNWLILAFPHLVSSKNMRLVYKRRSTLIFRLRMFVLNTPKNPDLNQGKLLATFS